MRYYTGPSHPVNHTQEFHLSSAAGAGEVDTLDAFKAASNEILDRMYRVEANGNTEYPIPPPVIERLDGFANGRLELCPQDVFDFCPSLEEAQDVERRKSGLIEAWPVVRSINIAADVKIMQSLFNAVEAHKEAIKQCSG
jgi:hypothetical protein